MKLLRVGEPKKEIPAILDNENKIRNLFRIFPNNKEKCQRIER